MPDDFDKWWDCLKKHTKRSRHWVPRAREISDEIPNDRPFRYFTLCARPMIDVFMLARENVLEHDDSFGQISDVVFCENNEEHYPEITEMLGVEGAGFPNDLVELALFRDDDYSSQFPNINSIDLELEYEGLDAQRRDLLLLKRQHLEFCAKFPRDFLNLDFCDYYYPRPPGIMKINETVDKLVELQRRQGQNTDGNQVSIGQFDLAVTCRFDQEVPGQAYTRLQNLVRDNQDTYRDYLEAIRQTRRVVRPEEWRRADNLDFFMSAWPKEILSIGRNHDWEVEIQDYMYYSRVGDHDNPYRILSLVARFSRHASEEAYLAQSLGTLNRDSRLFIDEVDPNSNNGQVLLADLREIVEVRNTRANIVGRPPLPQP